MKLNNKGFAITTVLYGLLILFVFLLASYFTVLTAKKNRLDRLTKGIEEDYYYNVKLEVNETFPYPYEILYTGKYVFDNDCVMYLYAGETLESNNNTCYPNVSGRSVAIKEIYYHGDDNNG